MGSRMPDVHAGFQDVSRSPDPAGLIEFLDVVDCLESVQAAKQRMRDLLEVQSGHVVLDAGCGLGHEALRLARLVGRNGHVLGVDKSELMIDHARERAKQAGVAVEWSVGDITRLDAADGSFDRCRAERVLMYIPDPPAAVAELVRVLKPGGRLVLFELDYGAIVVDDFEAPVTRWLDARLPHSVPSGRIGGQLSRLVRKSGLRGVQSVPHPYAVPRSVYERVVAGVLDDAVAEGALGSEAVERWRSRLPAGEGAGEGFATFLGFIVAGEKP